MMLRRAPSYVFRQLFDAESSTYTYLVGDAKTREAVLIDPVLEQLERDAKLLTELSLDLKFCLNTHVGSGRAPRHRPRRAH